jgi:hypothetical protein
MQSEMEIAGSRRTGVSPGRLLIRPSLSLSLLFNAWPDFAEGAKVRLQGPIRVFSGIPEPALDFLAG